MENTTPGINHVVWSLPKKPNNFIFFTNIWFLLLVCSISVLIISAAIQLHQFKLFMLNSKIKMEYILKQEKYCSIQNQAEPRVF